jgi:FkbM family methyltransferase
MNLKKLINAVLARFGFRISRVHEFPPWFGEDPFHDMRRLVRNEAATIFDVGANVGQTIDRFRRVLPDSVIHAFEPSATTFRELTERKGGTSKVVLNNLALGSEPGTRSFLENTHPEMNSFLEPGREHLGSVARRADVSIRTIDDYCTTQQIQYIDILKSDTQGFDLEVLKGARGLLRSNRIHMIYMEMTFIEMYTGMPRIDTIFSFLFDHHFAPVSFYNFVRRDRLLEWMDVLLINKHFLELDCSIPAATC